MLATSPDDQQECALRWRNVERLTILMPMPESATSECRGFTWRFRRDVNGMGCRLPCVALFLSALTSTRRFAACLAA